MPKKELMSIEARVLESLIGRINLMQPYEEKEALIMETISGVYDDSDKKSLKEDLKVLKSEQEKKQFTKELLSYGAIEELLENPDVEDIVINSLNPIFIHHSHKGFIPTDKRFESQKELEAL
jgi:Flp pilus assembly protein, ATPase CpaF